MAKIKTAYSINEASTCSINSEKPFIIANEITSKKGKSRNYTVFNKFTTFLKKRHNYQYSHEILIDHSSYVNNSGIDMMRQGGRLLFDFDIKYDEGRIIPINFKQQVESIVYKVIEKCFNDINAQKIIFVWSSCNNSIKLSKHLTIKNLYFYDWIVYSRFFYQKFIKTWNKTYFWIKGEDVIDKQIIRKNTSMRMVGSYKIGGNKLKFDSYNHTLEDSLIRIYRKSLMQKEQIVYQNNIKEKYINKYIVQNNKSYSEIVSTRKYINLITSDVDTDDFRDIHDKIIQFVNIEAPGVFSIGNINGNYINLTRLKPYRCILSGKIHDSENAYIIVLQNHNIIDIMFGCYRNCHKDKLKKIGTITKRIKQISGTIITI
nr:DEAD helicase [Mimivirus sp.]